MDAASVDQLIESLLAEELAAATIGDVVQAARRTHQHCATVAATLASTPSRSSGDLVQSDSLLAECAAILGLGKTATSSIIRSLEPFLLAAGTRAGALVGVDADAAAALLEEPWLSFLASAVAKPAQEEQFVHGTRGGYPMDLAIVLGAASALSNAAATARSETVLWHSGPGEPGTRGMARLRTELLVPERTRAILQYATVFASSASGTTEPDPECSRPVSLVSVAEPDPEQLATEDRAPSVETESRAIIPAQHSLTCACRCLLDFLSDDLAACEELIAQGAIPAVLRVAQSEGGAVAAGVGGILAALSTAPTFAAALSQLPSHDAGALVEIAVAEIPILGATTNNDRAANPALTALFNVCRATSPQPLPQRLADHGAVGLLAGVTQNRALPDNVRLDAADSLCRLMFPSDGLEDSHVPVAALRNLATKFAVSALVELSGVVRGSHLGASAAYKTALSSQREALRYRLPWLLSCVARGAASIDLAGWVEEDSGVRQLLLEAFSKDRSREVRTWGLDILAALCGRLAPDVFVSFMRRGPQPLLDAWPVLLRTERIAVRARAAIVAYFVASCLSGPSQSRGGAEESGRAEVLGLISLCRVPPGFWADTPNWHLSGGHRQLADVASTAAAVVAAEPLLQTQWPVQRWPELVTLCQLVTVGLDAQETLFQLKAAEDFSSGAAPGSANLRSWLLNACTALGELLADADKLPLGPGNEEPRAEIASLLGQLLDGPLRRSLAQTRKNGVEGKQGDCNSDSSDLDADVDRVSHRSNSAQFCDRLLVVAAQLLEGLLLGPCLYPRVVEALALQERRQDRILTPEETDRLSQERQFNQPLAALTEAARSIGTLEHGRVLTRILLRAFLVTVRDERTDQVDVVSSENSSEGPSMYDKRSVKLAAGMTSNANAPPKTWFPHVVSLEEAVCLDARLAAAQDESASACVNRASTCGDGSPVLQRWVGSRILSKNWRGLRAIMSFLSRLPGSGVRDLWPQSVQVENLQLVSTVFNLLALNRDVLGFGTNDRIITNMVEVSCSLLDATITSLRTCSGNDSDVFRAAADLHIATMEALQPSASVVAWQATTLADVFAYLWALVHVSSAGGLPWAADTTIPASTSCELPRASECTLRAKLWESATQALSAVLDNKDAVGSLCRSDDNAVVLAAIRRALGSVAAGVPLFARGSMQDQKSTAAYFFGPAPRGSVKDMLGRVSPTSASDYSSMASTPPKLGFIDLFEESWCPPGRVLLAATVRLIAVVLRTSSDALPPGCAEFLVVVIDAAARLLSTVVKPGSLLHSAEDVIALLTASATLLAEPPLANGDEGDAWRKRAGLMLVPLLHRPPIEALLAPHSAMEVLEEVPNGLTGLRWCARPDVETGLGPWGARARALLMLQEGGQPDERSDMEEDLADVPQRPLPAEDRKSALEEMLNLARQSPKVTETGAGIPPQAVAGEAAARSQDQQTVEEAAMLREEVSNLDSDLAALEAELEAELQAEIQNLEGAGANDSSATAPLAATYTVDARASRRIQDKRSRLVAEHHHVGRDAQLQSHASRSVAVEPVGLSQGVDMGTDAAELEGDDAHATLDNPVVATCGVSDRLAVGTGTNEVSASRAWDEFSPTELALMCTSGGGTQCSDSSVEASSAHVAADGAVDPPLVTTTEALPTEARNFLANLMSGAGDLASLREVLLVLLMDTLGSGGGSVEFQAAGLVEVYREPIYGIPETPHVRRALAYLFENAPRTSGDSGSGECAERQEHHNITTAFASLMEMD